MKSRMDKYYTNSAETSVKRSKKNKELYRNMYEDVEYSNVSGISILDANETIDINKINDLISETEGVKKKIYVEPDVEDIIIEDEKNYDLNDYLSKARENNLENTSYQVLRNIKIDDDFIVPDVKDEEVVSLIEARGFDNNSTLDLLDDLKSIYDGKLGKDIKEQLDKTLATKKCEIAELPKTRVIKREELPVANSSIDDQFYTSEMNFKSEDFDDMESEIKSNSFLIVISILVFLIIALLIGIFVFYYMNS